MTVSQLSNGELERRAQAGWLTLPVLAVYTMWVLELYEPNWWVASYGLGVAKRIPALLAGGLLLMTAGRAREKHWYWPVGLFVFVHIVPVFFVLNRGRLFEGFKAVLVMYVVMVASGAAITSVRRAVPLFLLFLFQFGWWMLHALPGARVLWEPFLGNDDGFSVLATMGMGFGYYAPRAIRSPRLRLAAYAIAILCTIGVVASFARGAIIATAFMLIMIIVRAPRRGRAVLSVAAVVAVFVVAQAILFPGGALWRELATSTEGVTQGTSGDRWELWKAAFRVYLHNPIVGAGSGNFGPAAAELVRFGELGGRYVDPSHIWGRVTHNVYMQILSELGTLGMLAFAVTVWDFFRRNARLRRPAVVEYWAGQTRGLIDVRFAALAMETAMIAYLATGVFYDQVYIQWFYLLVAMNLIFFWVTPRSVVSQARPSRAQSRAGLPFPAARDPGAEVRSTTGVRR